ncbi:MAG TPA: hypothetical protein VGQ33_11530, partial [Vicinamibacteria bacterium]|nr:hypothetical protein [Vicinamibacteria bacterium]
LRDLGDRVVSAAPHQAGLDAIPPHAVDADTLLPRGASASLVRRAPPLPTEGARLAVVTHQRQVGWLDFWGDGAPATASSRETVTGLGRVLGALLARDAAR